MKRKLLTLVLALLLAISLIPASVFADEPVTLKVLLVMHELTKYPSEIDLYRQIEEMANVKFEFTVVRSGWSEKKATMLASGDLPDMILSTGISDTDIAQNTEYFVPLNDYLDQMPNLTRVFEEAPELKAASTQLDGNIYSVPSQSFFGGESRAKVFSSYPVPGGADYPIDLTANLPTAVVSAVDPLLLCARIVDCSCGNCCDCAAVTGVPTGIAEAFDEPILFEPQTRRVCISIGQFSIVRLERGTQLLIPTFDYCIPTKQCPNSGVSGAESPCDVFGQIEFPMDAFFPSKNDACIPPSQSCTGCARTAE